MKYLISILFIMAGVSASAMEVTVKCTPKAFSCFNGPNGVECSWYELNEGVYTTVMLNQSINKEELWFGRHQENLDGHLLTLDFRYDESKNRNPLHVSAYLAAANVMAETSGHNSVDVALRNNNYGRGFVCTQMRVHH